MTKDIERIMNQARVREFRKEDQEDLAQETWARSIALGQENEPKYMTAVLKNTLLKKISNIKTAERNALGVTMSFYSNDNSLKDAHLKKDIMKCYAQLNEKQKEIFAVIADEPDADQKTWAANMGMELRTFAYHLYNIRAIFKGLLEDNKLVVHTEEYLKRRKVLVRGRGAGYKTKRRLNG